jgi:hypothetical protein
MAKKNRYKKNIISQFKTREFMKDNLFLTLSKQQIEIAEYMR